MLTKYASSEDCRVLDIWSSPTRIRTANFERLADFDSYRTADGYLYARIRAISSRVNRNHDGWPSIELAGGQDVFDRHLSSEGGFTVVADNALQEGFSTFLGKPIFIDHHNSDPKRARGAIVDAQFHVDDHKTASLDPYYSSPEVDPEHLPGTWVELLLEVDAKSFPKFAKAIVAGSRDPKKGIDGWSMGCDVKFSKCSVCAHKATCPEEYCTHIRMKGAYFDHRDKTGRRISKKAYENCYGVSFFEISGVFDPADETALSREVVSKTQEETITQDPKEEGLKDLADDQAEDYLEDTERKKQKRKRSFEMSDMVECPNCAGVGRDDNERMCRMCGGMGFFKSPHPGGEGTAEDSSWRMPLDELPGGAPLGEMHQGAIGELYEIAELRKGLPPQEDRMIDQWLREYGEQTVLQWLRGRETPEQVGQSNDAYEMLSSTKLAENPPPQSDMIHAPEKVDTLREEHICPVCGSSMDEDKCDVCSYQEPPEGFDNPDLTKAREGEDQGPTEPMDDVRMDAPGVDLTETQGTPQATNVPKNPALVAHVTSDMGWEVHSSEKTAARINKIEKPLVATDKPQTNEPQETIVSDQSQPITSRVRTAEDFIAAVTTKENNHMSTPRVADSAPPSNEPRDKGHHPMDDARSPEKVVDVLGVGGVMDATNEQASKANAQIDVTGIGGTGVESVSADEADGGQVGVKVDQGDEHSKNIEAIHTDTWGPNEGDSLGQQDPTTSQTPWWQDNGSGFKGSHWVVESHDDAAFPEGEDIAGGAAVEGNQPIAEQFGERVNVLDHVTSPANNSGPTKTWTGTDGNGVLKQQDPVTPASISRGESGMENAPNWTASTQIFAAFKLADMEVEMGLIPAEKKYERAAELEKETPATVVASLKYAQRIKQAAHRAAGAQQLPVMGRSSAEKVVAAKMEKGTSAEADDSFMFGGL